MCSVSHKLCLDCYCITDDQFKSYLDLYKNLNLSVFEKLYICLVLEVFKGFFSTKSAPWLKELEKEVR